MTRVVLQARGLVCAFGVGEEALWRGLLEGESAVGPCADLLPGLTGAAQPLAARVPESVLPAHRHDRALVMLRLAAAQLQSSPAWSASGGGGRLGLCLGTTQGEVRAWEAEQIAVERDPERRPAAPLLSGPTHALARALGADGPVATLSMACASGAAAIIQAARWIRQGRCERAVAGGADSLSQMVHAGFQSLRALDPKRARPFDRRRAGLSLGEGAALVLLDSAAAPPPGAVELLGGGLSSDAHHLTGPDPEGRGLARAISAALVEAGQPTDAVEAVNAHGTGTVFNDLMEAKALRSVFGPRAVRLPVNSIKGAIGHSMGAAGAIEAVLCAGVLERGLLPATTGLEQSDPALGLDGLVQGEARPSPYRCLLSTSSGFGGINAALLLGRA